MDLDQYITTIRSGGRLKEDDVISVFNKLMEVLYQEGTVHPLPLPITICGDIHGQLYDLFELFEISGGPENNRYLFCHNSGGQKSEIKCVSRATLHPNAP